MRPDALVVSCEHASNHVPAAYRPLFRGARQALHSHQGWDVGALRIARFLAERLEAPLFAGKTTRLLVDLNRSPHHPRLFSRWTRDLSTDDRRRLLERYYDPYRFAVAHHIRQMLSNRRRVLHLSVHSFTPTWGGVRRSADLGLLYDPRRRSERRFCSQWKTALAIDAPALRVRRNYPYRGTSDGFSVALRRLFGDNRYGCVELEINQKLLRGTATTHTVERALVDSLERLLDAPLRQELASMRTDQ